MLHEQVSKGEIKNKRKIVGRFVKSMKIKHFEKHVKSPQNFFIGWVIEPVGETQLLTKIHSLWSN